MRREIEILVKKYGSLEKVGRTLGVGLRQMQNVQSGQKVGASLRKLILIKIKLIEVEEIE